MNRDDELLASIVAGDVREDSPQARALFARQPQARERLRELAEIRRELDHGGELERSVIAQARVEATTEDRTRVAAALAPRVASRSSQRWFRVAAIAAAVVVMGGAALYFARRDETPPQVNVLRGGADDSVELLTSDLRLSAGAELAWKAPPLASSERFKLQFRALGAADQPGKLLREIRCATASWTPTAADLASWPEQVSLVVLRVEADNADRELARSSPFSLRVSR